MLTLFRASYSTHTRETNEDLDCDWTLWSIDKTHNTRHAFKRIVSTRPVFTRDVREWDGCRSDERERRRERLEAHQGSMNGLLSSMALGFTLGDTTSPAGSPANPSTLSAKLDHVEGPSGMVSTSVPFM